MTAQLLTSELSALVHESKRKNVDIRTAAEKSLNELKALPNTSEAQTAADLKRRPNFVRPFILACATRNSKYASTAIICLQRLIVTNGLAQETLKDVLEVLRECSSLGLDIQLKILQALPSLLQNYSNQLSGDLLAITLHICFLLLVSKTAVVSNTAAATLQQLVISVLGKAAQEDESTSDVPYVTEVVIEDGTVSVRQAALDAYQLLNDLCLLTEGQKPQFLYPSAVSPDFGLELIESMLSNYAETVSLHPEQIQVLRTRLMPFIIRVLSERVAFSTTVRVIRLLPMIFGNMLSLLTSECEMILGLLNHMLDPDAALIWKRVLCMEVFRGIYYEPSLLRSIYMHYDEQEGKRNIVQDHLSIMVRLAAEKPLIIGLGQQSTVPAASTQAEDELDEQAALQAEGVAGTIGVAMTLRSSTAPGISMQWSNMRVPCIEQLDKVEPPTIPAAYLYSLTLTCMNNFSEGLARFLLPFSIASEVRLKKKARRPDELEPQSTTSANGEETIEESRKPGLLTSQSFSGSRIPVNPLTLEDHVLYSQIRTSANMVDTCWPALLAAYSTFLHAALDAEYYHALVRSFQKFSQIAGLLRLSTPRDAFLTTLGKNAVPPAVGSSHSMTNLTSNHVSKYDSKQRASSIQDTTGGFNISPQGTLTKARHSFDLGATSLNTRNLLCLRALLNLGIALGPVLEGAWSIILETLQQADLVISHMTSQRRSTHNGQSTPITGGEQTFLGDIGNEIAAVKIATTRMFESCTDLPDYAFLDLVSNLKNLLRDLDAPTTNQSSTSSRSLERPPSHRRATSTAGTLAGANQDVRLNEFVVENLDKLITQNSSRLLAKSPKDSGWDVVLDALVEVVGSQTIDTRLRLKGANTLCDMAKLTASSSIPEHNQNRMREQGLIALLRQVQTLHSEDCNDSKHSKICEAEIHALCLETLHTCLEQYGDSLHLGWEYVFVIITSIFAASVVGTDLEAAHISDHQMPALIAEAKSPKLVRSAFGSLQLICSDFLISVPRVCLPKLLATTHRFCSQHEDFNISLTATTLFWNISDRLWYGIETMFLDDCVTANEISDEIESETSGHSKAITNSVMWMRLMLLLAQSTIDERVEVRHSALHTIFRIFDTCDGKLRPGSILICHKIILLGLLSRNHFAYANSRVTNSSEQQVELASWNETAIIILDDVSNSVGHSLEFTVKEHGFQEIWEAWGSSIQRFLDRRSLSLSTAVFSSISKVLSDQRDVADMALHAKIFWDIWRNGNPADHIEVSSASKFDNQPALVAYLKSVINIYSFLNGTLESEDIKAILNELRTCVTGSTATTYAGDVDIMTPLQLHVIECIQMIRTDTSGSATSLIASIAGFVVLAYIRKTDLPGQNGPTFLALSKAAMDVLKDCIIKHANVEKIFYDRCLSEAICSLTEPIRLKSSWQIVGKDPPPWKKATSTAMAILTKIIPTLQKLRITDSSDPATWRDIVNICDAIISVKPTTTFPLSILSLDQGFDVDTFKELISLLVPALGSTLLTDKLRLSFTESLFKNSLIHAPHADDLPRSDGELLEGLQSEHIGRTQDLPPSPHSKMNYLLVDELFDLTAKHDSSLERVKLAQAAAPYLILRVGLVLKAYILDQPLRGRMPLPLSQKQEMLYVLNKLVDLDSEPRAIPDAPGVVSEHKKHLHRVYTLIVKALKVARQDGEVRKSLTQVLDMVSQDWSV